jgi:hypothetical protein
VIPFTDPGTLLGISHVGYIESPGALAIVGATLEGAAREAETLLRKGNPKK